ncbi:MAG: helix-turn-helix domain-containing protein [Thermoguttaceae bacterium]|jgi:hypothetical protein
MIAHGVVDEIRHLLDQGAMSQRKIARRLGVSRGTVNAIALGTRPDYLDRRDELGGFFPPAGPPRRCPGCGGMVFMPCLLCHVRAMKNEGIRD